MRFRKREEECRKVILVPGAQSAEAAQKAVSGLVNAMPGEQYDRQEWFSR